MVALKINTKLIHHTPPLILFIKLSRTRYYVLGVVYLVDGDLRITAESLILILFMLPVSLYIPC